MDLINLDRVKQLTGAKTDEEAALKLKTVLEVIEDFLGVVLFKTDFKDEKNQPCLWKLPLYPP